VLKHLQSSEDWDQKSIGSKGFTLIELLVVIVIIGILLAIAVPSYLGFRDRASDTAAQANIRAAVPSAEAYFADHGNYTSMAVGPGANSGDGARKLVARDGMSAVFARFCVRGRLPQQFRAGHANRMNPDQYLAPLGLRRLDLR